MGKIRKEVYLKVRELLDKKHKAERKELAKRYAKKNTLYEKGQIIRDDSCTIKIDNVSYGVPFGGNIPEPYYLGYVLKKDLTPRKNEERSWIRQSQIKEAMSGKRD